MANEKTTEKVNETVTEAPKTKTEIPTAPTEKPIIDAIFDVEDDEEIDDEVVSSVQSGTTVLYSNCGYLRRDKGSIKDGFQYYNYKVKFNAPVHGKPFTHELFFKLHENFKPKHQVLDEFYGDEKMLPLHILRSERVTRKNNIIIDRQYFYTVQLRLEGDYGIMPFSFDPTSKETFEWYINVLKEAHLVE